MKKDFDRWNKIKKEVHSREQKLFFHEREVWWCTCGLNIGSEQDGQGHRFVRPVLIFRKFNEEVFWSLPLTLQAKHNRFHESIDLGDGIERWVILSQLKLIDSRRLEDKITTISTEGHEAIEKATIRLMPSGRFLV